MKITLLFLSLLIICASCSNSKANEELSIITNPNDNSYLQYYTPV